jgi:hypothetical protein
MARIPVPALVDGSVLFDGRVAQIIGFDGALVKLRFADGGDVGVSLADYILQARATDPSQRSRAASPAPTVPWEPTGQRARHVRETLNGYVAGRKAALHELESRAGREQR